MLPQTAAEYKLVLVGDSAVGTTLIIQANLHCSINSCRAPMMRICCQLSEWTSNSGKSKLGTNKSSSKFGIQLVRLV